MRSKYEEGAKRRWQIFFFLSILIIAVILAANGATLASTLARNFVPPPAIPLSEA